MVKIFKLKQIIRVNVSNKEMGISMSILHLCFKNQLKIYSNNCNSFTLAEEIINKYNFKMCK